MYSTIFVLKHGCHSPRRQGWQKCPSLEGSRRNYQTVQWSNHHTPEGIQVGEVIRHQPEIIWEFEGEKIDWMLRIGIPWWLRDATVCSACHQHKAQSFISPKKEVHTTTKKTFKSSPNGYASGGPKLCSPVCLKYAVKFSVQGMANLVRALCGFNSIVFTILTLNFGKWLHERPRTTPWKM